MKVPPPAIPQGSRRYLRHPDLTAVARLDELGLVVVGQRSPGGAEEVGRHTFTLTRSRDIR